MSYILKKNLSIVPLKLLIINIPKIRSLSPVKNNLTSTLQYT